MADCDPRINPLFGIDGAGGGAESRGGGSGGEGGAAGLVKPSSPPAPPAPEGAFFDGLPGEKVGTLFFIFVFFCF